MKPVLLAMLAIGWAYGQSPPPPRVPRMPVEQPLPFSHKTHVRAGAACRQCHPMPEPGEFMLLPATAVCMGCHATVKKDSEAIRRLAGYHAEGKRVPWKAVYRIPDWVSFSHKKHLAAEGVTCENCHGPVAEREALARERDLGMQACMDCHRDRKVSNECAVCHDPR